MVRQFLCNNTDTVAVTPKGKIRGFQQDGTYVFQGIKYADAKRFQEPTQVPAWDGIKDALAYGYVCPLMNQDNPTNELMVPHRYWPQDENCQYLNIWTQTLCPQAKKPVMVWLHGGGFAAGSSIEQVAYEGENMSREGDVVVVSINHRLNIVGYLDLSPFGEKYKNSGNAGSADMVAALQWVHDNITAFGGDPENVTIFGQSGGGMKVWNLMQIPAADGLFQKGIIQSGLLDGLGLGLEAPRGGDGKAIVTAMMQELGFDEVEKLETVPYPELAAAYQKVAMEVAKKGEYIGGNPLPNEFYLGDPRIVGFCEHAKTIPVIIGTVFGEFAFGPTVEGRLTMSEEDAKKLLVEKFGEQATQKLIPMYQKAYPDKCLADLLVLDTMFRKPTIDFVEKKSAHSEAPTWSYLFAYEFPFEKGKPAWHCSEIPFVFHNTNLVPICGIAGVSDKLESQMFTAWMNFAKYGNPNHPGIPCWEASKPGDEACMIFDRTCKVCHSHDHELVDLLAEVTPKFTFGSGKIEH